MTARRPRPRIGPAGPGFPSQLAPSVALFSSNNKSRTACPSCPFVASCSSINGRSARSIKGSCPFCVSRPVHRTVFFSPSQYHSRCTTIAHIAACLRVSTSAFYLDHFSVFCHSSPSLTLYSHFLSPLPSLLSFAPTRSLSPLLARPLSRPSAPSSHPAHTRSR